jgi:hypothetical protein
LHAAVASVEATSITASEATSITAAEATSITAAEGAPATTATKSVECQDVSAGEQNGEERGERDE